MPKLRYQGTEQVYVSALDRLVDPDEVIDVDDALVWKPSVRDDKGEIVEEGNETGLVWPEEQWAEVSSRSKAKAGSKATSADTDKNDEEN